MKQLPVALLTMGLALAASLAAAPSARVQNSKPKMRYAAEQAGDSIVLTDRTTDTTVSILPSLGNIAYEMKVKGHNVLRNPHATVDEFRKAPNTVGIPFMGPWANRLDEQAFYANGKRYPFDMALGNVRGAIPIHGFVTTTDQWKVVEMKATRDEAWVKSRLDFYKVPAWMKQWPFAHTVDMTYRLKDGVLEVLTEVTNLANEPMPLVIGYHPHFKLTDSKRDEWTASIAAKKHYLLSPQKLPTGRDRADRDVRARSEGRLGQGPRPRRRLRRPGARRAGARHVHGDGQGAEARRDLRTQLQGRRRLGPEAAGGAGAQLHLLRADGRRHQRRQHGVEGHLQRAAVDCAGRDLARELVGQAERVRGVATAPAAK